MDNKTLINSHKSSSFRAFPLGFLETSIAWMHLVTLETHHLFFFLPLVHMCDSYQPYKEELLKGKCNLHLILYFLLNPFVLFFMYKWQSGSGGRKIWGRPSLGNGRKQQAIIKEGQFKSWLVPLFDLWVRVPAAPLASGCHTHSQEATTMGSQGKQRDWLQQHQL